MKSSEIWRWLFKFLLTNKLNKVIVAGIFRNFRWWSKIKSDANVKSFIFTWAWIIYLLTPKKSTATCLNCTNGEQVCERGEKTPCCTSYHDFGAFLRHFVFSTIIDNFSTFFRRYVQPRKYFKKVENLTISWPVFESEQKNSIFIFYENFIFFLDFFVRN